MADVRETNKQLLQQFSNVVERDGNPFISAGTVAITFFTPPEGADTWEQNDFPIFYNALLANRDVDEKGVSDVTLRSVDGLAGNVKITRAETKRGIDDYEDEFDFVPYGLSYPVISVTIWNNRADKLRLVETPYGQYPPNVVDAEGNWASFDDRTFLLDTDGRGYQIQDVTNWGEPDEDVSKLQRVDFSVDEARARAVPLTDAHRARHEGLLTEIEEGKWSVVSRNQENSLKKHFNLLVEGSQGQPIHRPLL